MTTSTDRQQEATMTTDQMPESIYRGLAFLTPTGTGRKPVKRMPVRHRVGQPDLTWDVAAQVATASVTCWCGDVQTYTEHGLPFTGLAERTARQGGREHVEAARA
jgi:hypothetical protein